MSLVAVPAARVVARARPLAVGLVYAYELAWALVVATPAHAWARRVWGEHPDGDAVLWAPGGRELLTWVGSMDPAIAVTTRTSMLLLFVGALAGQIALGFLLVSLAGEREGGRAPRWADAFAAGVKLWLPMTTVSIGSWLGSGVLVALGLAAGGALDASVASSSSDTRAFQLRVALVVVSLLLAAALSVFADLVRAAIAAGEVDDDAPRPAWSRLAAGARRAVRVGRRGFGRALVAWAVRAGLGLVLVLGGAAASDALGGKSGAALAALFLLHQVVVFGRTALRASFLARALRLVS